MFMFINHSLNIGFLIFSVLLDEPIEDSFDHHTDPIDVKHKQDVKENIENPVGLARPVVILNMY